MKKLAIFSLLIAFSISAAAQSGDTGTLFLHKFARNIGKETWRATKTDSGYHYKIDFKFTDRGRAVPLQASIFVNNNAEAKKLWIKGSTSRFSSIHDSITINGQTAWLKVDDSAYTKQITGAHFLIGGYAPGTVQMLLLQYWEKHGQPEVINILPNGSLRIKKDGTDVLNGLTLQRYIISGLIWGNEIVWTDEKGNLVCLITNDAEGDKMEMMQAKHESLLPQFIAKAAGYSMRLFKESLGDKKAGNNTIALVGGNVLNVENGTWIKNATVLVQDGKIMQVGGKDAVSIPANASIINAEGKSILPGLWDMHAHFQQAEWGPAYLGSGVTTVRDVGNEFEYINAIQESINSGEGVGPRILKAGIIDGSGNIALGVITATNREEAVAAVRKYKQSGFIQIKLYSSVKPNIVKIISEEAHKQGLTVTGHIPEGMDVLQAIDAGMDAVNHMQYVYAVMKKYINGSINWNHPFNIKVLDRLQKSKTVIDATIGVYEMILRTVDEDITAIEPAFRTLPLPLQSLFEHTGMPAERAKSFKPMFEGMQELVKRLHDKGVTIVAGTDMMFPGNSLHRELELYVTAGLTPLDAIRSATIVPARVMKLDGKLGSVTMNKNADLIIVNGDPLADIKNIRKVELVIKDGKLYDPLEMKRVAGFIVGK